MRRIVALALGAVLMAATVPVPAGGVPLDSQGDRRITAVPEAPALAAATAPSGMSPVIVTMRSRADLGSIPGANPAARRQGIILALQAQAANSQRALLRYLDGEKALGHVAGDTSFWVFNGLSVTATPEVIQALAARADVASVTSDVAGIALGLYDVVLAPDAPLFVDSETGNFYLAAGSPAIDSSIDSLPDRQVDQSPPVRCLLPPCVPRPVPRTSLSQLTS